MMIAVMTPFGWAFMLISWAIIFGITFYCFFKILRSNRLDDPEE